MSESTAPQPDRFNGIKATIDKLLPDGEVRLTRTFGSVDVAIWRDDTDGTYGIDMIDPVDDNHSRDVRKFVFEANGSGRIISTLRHVSDGSGEKEQIQSEAPIATDAQWRRIVGASLAEYIQPSPVEK